MDQETNEYHVTANDIANLVTEKNRAYGDSFNRSGDILRILYPDDISPVQYDDMLYIVRVLDKLFRIATDKDALNEDPVRDIAGYSILKAAGNETVYGYDAGEGESKSVSFDLSLLPDDIVIENVRFVRADGQDIEYKQADLIDRDANDE